jgi:HlyD family secretion protein
VQFRQQALAKLQSPEELDLPVRLARPRGRLVLAVGVVAMAAAAFWAVTGTVSSTVPAPGVLTYGQGSYVLQSPVAGQVTSVRAQPGARVAANAPLAVVRAADGGTTTVRALAAGRVTSMDTAIGAVVRTGAAVATVERVSGPHDPLMALVYVPASGGVPVAPGQHADLSVQSAPSQQYGVLRGTVRAVGRTAQTRQQITAAVGDGQLAARFTRDGQAVAVLVELAASSRTASHYAWSSPSGPPFALTSMTPVDGSVRVAQQHPAAWLLP